MGTKGVWQRSKSIPESDWGTHFDQTFYGTPASRKVDCEQCGGAGAVAEEITGLLDYCPFCDGNGWRWEEL